MVSQILLGFQWNLGIRILHWHTIWGKPREAATTGRMERNRCRGPWENGRAVEKSTEKSSKKEIKVSISLIEKVSDDEEALRAFV
ncbi:hypothetical protein Nepgr_033126 [Nepenthes gracilis]|uniref:Uncharacterized protein n=1 Tax=Nepenthes gracilis TaxID=150966 RepID=A0AAD3TLR0_NEPGR|nr:hypothetical protein Nepgr_033126 [Nepenthes gracilis]